MSSNYGRNLRLSVFGQSHGAMIGAVIDGLPVGEEINIDELQQFVERRSPGRDEYSTSRKEPDMVEIVSGLHQGKTCGAPLCLIIANSDTRSADYEQLRSIPRPAHADYTAKIRYHGYNDPRGGGHFSGRLTAPLTAAGAICLQILKRRGINVAAHLSSIGNEQDTPIADSSLNLALLSSLTAKTFPTVDDAAGERMQQAIRQAKEAGDSLGGCIEVFALGVPAGLGSPMFDGVENRLAAALFAIPAVKGVEFGSGFGAASMYGSEHNDAFCFDGSHIGTKTNHHGGILGGITSGMPIIVRAAIKPTPSISRPQQTLNMDTMKESQLAIKGRHDPCIAQRAVPCLEAVTGFVLLDLLMDADYQLVNI